MDAPLTREEVVILEQLAQHHRYADFLPRELSLLALNKGCSVIDLADVFRASGHPIYNWTNDWQEKNLVGILDVHKGGAPAKLTVGMLDLTAVITRQESLPLARIAARMAEQFPEAPAISLDRISVGLKKRGRPFRRTRLSLNKNAMKQHSCVCLMGWA